MGLERCGGSRHGERLPASLHIFIPVMDLSGEIAKTGKQYLLTLTILDGH
jgi:hypothetical protein